MNEYIERLMRALSNPSVYPHHPDSVQVVQTHISIVFLSGAYVYKVKKPLSLGFLDFTTLDKRKFLLSSGGRPQFTLFQRYLYGSNADL